jgi:hypothetical protein
LQNVLASGIKIQLRLGPQYRIYWLSKLLRLPDNIANIATDTAANFNKAYWSWQCLKMIATDDNSKDYMAMNFIRPVVIYSDEGDIDYTLRIDLSWFIDARNTSMINRVNGGINTYLDNTRIPDDMIAPAILNNDAVMNKLGELNLI